MTKPFLKVLVNREGGAAAKAGNDLLETVNAAFAAVGVGAEVELLAPDALGKALEAAVGNVDRLVVAGGDGTIAGAAQVLAGTDTELAILPLGTLNHFARDLAIPFDLDAAAALAAKGQATGIDVGRINERRFINNASIGVYPLMVRQRDAVRKRRGWPKWLATLPAFAYTLSRLPHHRLHVDMGRGDKPIVTPLLFVGNNRYSLDRGTVGSRESLCDGYLSVYAVRHRTRKALLWLAARTLFGRADPLADFEMLDEGADVTVRSTSGSIEIGVDGEVMRLQSPLRFMIEPQALRVVVPARGA